MIKLIVIDLDGTLLNSDKSISRENEEAIMEALERGVHVSISPEGVTCPDTSTSSSWA